MRPFRRPLVVVTTVAALAVAGQQAPAQSVPKDTPDKQIRDGSAQRALDRARSAWKKAHVRRYRFRIALSCFCGPDATRPRTITVVGTTPRHPPSNLKSVATVPRMFRRIQGSIDARVAGFDVTYGPRGVPRHIIIDPSTHIADEEFSYRVDRFTKLG